MATRLTEDCLKGKLDELKELYAQLFVLLDRSLADAAEGDEDAPHPSVELAAPIAGLMQDIEGKADDFREALEAVGDWRADLSQALGDEIEQYRGKLREGLEAIKAGADQRIAAISTERDGIKTRLEGLRDRQRTRSGYRGPVNAPSTLFDSKA